MSIQNGFIYEEGITRNMLSIMPTNKNVIDIGANLGTHTVLFADHILPGGGIVLCIRTAGGWFISNFAQI